MCYRPHRIGYDMTLAAIEWQRKRMRCLEMAGMDTNR